MTTSSPAQERHEFQAEIKQLLHIVIHSLYTDREVFVRELVSNASDALEKLRFITITEQEYHDKGLPLEIRLEADELNKTLTIRDTGVGMTHDELTRNLGAIAHSGAAEFLRSLDESRRAEAQLIGQFGLGFYSVFMVADHVRVRTRSYRLEERGWEWSCDGGAGYTIAPADGVARGAAIIVHLKQDAHEFADPKRVREIVRRYSNFVAFPIYVNGEQVNTIQAIWTRNKQDVAPEEYAEFYKFLTNSSDEPLMRLHVQSDAPLQVNALLFVPRYNTERFGFGPMEPGVSLYSRKVLIRQRDPDILPDYLRFVRGVVDSLDLPLNVSRENPQDSRLIARLRKVLTERLIRHFNEQADKDPAAYQTFWENFGLFIKEGIARDLDHKDKLATLLRYESSATKPGETVSLKQYVERMVEGQEAIYYLNGPQREVIEAGPYCEAFRARNIEVLYVYEPVDDFVLSALREFDGKALVSADRADLDLPGEPETAEGGDRPDTPAEQLSALLAWLRETLSGKIKDVRLSRRLIDSPACLVNPNELFTTSMQRVMQAAHKELFTPTDQLLEINPRHPLIARLAALCAAGEDSALLRAAAEQILDNARLAAGLLTDPRGLVERSYRLLETALGADKRGSA